MTNDFVPVSQPSLGNIERQKLLDAFDSSWISSSGRYLDEFETRFAERTGANYCVGVSNGTVALHLALAALGVGRGDEVLVPSMTYIATANAVTYVGAEPVLAEICESDWGLSVDKLRPLVTERTRALIAVHLYGVPCDMVALRTFCDEVGIWFIEDAAEGPFSSRDGITAGTVCDVATFSFYGNKVLTSGEGGCVTTKSPGIADRLRLLRGQGMSPTIRYWFTDVGFNFRMTNLQAAILCGQMDRLDAILDRRAQIFAQYDRYFVGRQDVHCLPAREGWYVSPWLYCLVLESRAIRDRVAAELYERGIDSRPFFYPLHTMPPHLQRRRAADLSFSEDLSKRGLNLPTFTDMSDDTVRRVAEAVLESIDGAGR